MAKAGYDQYKVPTFLKFLHRILFEYVPLTYYFENEFNYGLSERDIKNRLIFKLI